MGRRDPRRRAPGSCCDRAGRGRGVADRPARRAAGRTAGPGRTAGGRRRRSAPGPAPVHVGAGVPRHDGPPARRVHGAIPGILAPHGGPAPTAMGTGRRPAGVRQLRVRHRRPAAVLHALPGDARRDRRTACQGPADDGDGLRPSGAGAVAAECARRTLVAAGRGHAGGVGGVGHGGFGTTMLALAAGVPQVIVPLFASDQHVNARHVAATGAGVCLDGGPDDLGRSPTRSIGYSATRRFAALAGGTAPPAHRGRPSGVGSAR